MNVDAKTPELLPKLVQKLHYTLAAVPGCIVWTCTKFIVIFFASVLAAGNAMFRIAWGYILASQMHKIELRRDRKI